MSDAPEEQVESGGLLCPNCGNPAETVSPEGLARCSECGQQFLAGLADPELGIDSGSFEDEPAQDDSELSELRIRNVASLRRGAYRSRSYLIIAAGVCVVAAAKLIQIATIAWRGRLHFTAVGDALFAVAAAIGLVVIGRKISILTHEIHSSRLQDPASPPDLSNLGDGSQRFRDLETMTTPIETSTDHPQTNSEIPATDLQERTPSATTNKAG